MASNKKSKKINKRLTHEASSSQTDSGEPKQRKKPSGKMGPQWSRGELERFYNAYQKHGRDWKKVASEVSNTRSGDMVEALFSTHKAFLSLPEGTASLAGFIAMMTDHHSFMEESKSEGEGHVASAVPKIHQKRKRAKLLPSDLNNEGCLALLKQTQDYGRRRRASAKRTPRVDVTEYYAKECVNVEVPRDELEALQTLNGLSEPSAPLKGERIAKNKHTVSTSNHREIPKQAETDDSGKMKSVEGLIDCNSVPLEELGTSRSILKPKESAKDSCLKTLVKERPVGQCHAKQLKSAKIPEESSSTGQDLVVSATQVSGLPQKPPNRRKMSLKKSLQERDKSFVTTHETPHRRKKNSEYELLKKKLSTCLSCPLARRWCKFEWFYSTIDYPWFAKMGFNDYLSNVGFGHVPNLTRLEWSVIKSSIGKPRRFSERFVQQERDKLEQYRESVRQVYTKIRTGVRVAIPIDLPMPLSVKDTVIAIYPKTKEICDGNILTVDHNKCNVLFGDLGSHFVMDIDCMPLNQLKYFSEGLRRLVGNRHPNTDAYALSRPPVLKNVNFPMNPSVKQRMEREMLGFISGSRSIAHEMVDAAMKAESSVKDEEDAGKMVQQAIDDFLVPCSKLLQDQSNGGLGHHQNQQSRSNSNERQMARELITSCVATCLMIKECMEKQYPSEVVAQMMETAMSGLQQPRGSQNMPIYREILTCLGLIKSQIMGRVRR